MKKTRDILLLFFVCLTFSGCGVLSISEPKSFQHASNYQQTMDKKHLTHKSTADGALEPDLYLFSQMLAEQNQSTHNKSE